MAIRTRVIAVGSILLIVLSLAVVFTFSDFDPPQSGTMTPAVNSGSKSPPTVLDWELASIVGNMTSTKLSEVVDEIAPGIKFPPASLVGEPVKTALVASFAQDPNKPYRQEQGLMVYYDKGVLFSAQPMGSTLAPNPRASQEIEDQDILKWEDGRTQAYTVGKVNGCDAVIQPGGIKVDSYSGDRYEVNPVLVWVENGVEYLLESDTLSVDQLRKIAEQMK